MYAIKNYFATVVLTNVHLIVYDYNMNSKFFNSFSPYRGCKI
jgi:hypothetical protein